MPKIRLLLFLLLAGNLCYAQNTPTPDSSKVVAAAIGLKDIGAKERPKASLGIYPNPAKNKVTLRVSDFNPGMCAVRIMDTRGKLIKEEQRLLVSGNEEIVVFLMLNPGIYFIVVSEPGKTARKKLVLM